MPKSIPKFKVTPFIPFSAALAILAMVLGPGVTAIVTRYKKNSNTLNNGNDTASNLFRCV